MNFENQSFEQKQTPEKLYRGFVIDPESLSVEMFTKPLVMGLQNKLDPTKTLDGNEAGVYMSSNQSMIESTNYSNNQKGFVSVPKYASRYGPEDKVRLRGCGIVVEVQTKGLEVREPKIDKILQGHYNNGFEGKEWIADEIPASHYRPLKFILSLGANDNKKIVVNVKGDTEEDIAEAISEIKKHAVKELQDVELFKTFLESLTDQQRSSGFGVKKRWEKFLEDRKK